MQKRRRFMLDTNVFIAAFKSGYTRTTQLILKLLTDPSIELIANSILLEEHMRTSRTTLHVNRKQSLPSRARSSTHRAL